jgi:hypothetical protein
MRVSTKLMRSSLLVAVMVAAMVLPAVASAAGHLPPVPIVGPRTEPRPIPILAPAGDMKRVDGKNLKAIPLHIIYNYVATSLPPQSTEAAAAAATQDIDGKPGILKTTTAYGMGTTLYDPSGVCLDFNNPENWSASDKSGDVDIWTDQFGGWGYFAIDDGYYIPEVVTFSRERVVGPGRNYNADNDADGRNSLKIASTQPYAAGAGSPIINVKPGSEVMVTVSYLIYHHDFDPGDKNWDYDWASLGVKPDAYGDTATYVNGYTRGQWWEMSNTVTAGNSGQIMVLLQAQSPAALNSNIYFDNVRIYVDGVALKNCMYE